MRLVIGATSDVSFVSCSVESALGNYFNVIDVVFEWSRADFVVNVTLDCLVGFRVIYWVLEWIISGFCQSDQFRIENYSSPLSG